MLQPYRDVVKNKFTVIYLDRKLCYIEEKQSQCTGMFLFTIDQILILTTILGALFLFIWGRIRYDVVALMALLVSVITGVVPYDRAFSGFSHPAVIMTACILILTNALSRSGSFDILISHLHTLKLGATSQLFVLVLGVTVCSAFMNNIGALSLILPITVQYAHRANISPYKLLMPISFGSLLGGLTTLIGTPPNIIIANFRNEAVGESFGMFDFLYVGGIVAIIGTLFVTLIGWRFLPERHRSEKAGEMFNIREYITEIGFQPNSPLIGKTLDSFRLSIPGEVSILTLFRNKQRFFCPSQATIIEPSDILVLEGNPISLQKLFDSQAIFLVPTKDKKFNAAFDLDVKMIEVIVPPDSSLIGTTGKSFYRLFDAILLGISKKGRYFIDRFNLMRFEPGDILLLQGTKQGLQSALDATGALPLAGQKLQPVQGKKTFWPLYILIGAVALTSLKLFSASIAFLLGVVILLVMKKIKYKQAYHAIDYSILVLIGCMFPIGEALSMTGTTSMIVNTLLIQPNFSDYILISLLLAICMLLSDVMNNAATALIMAPIAVELARNLGASIDPFLITVALGSSCTFLTPIGHPSNMLVMGPGGYKFNDYWRMGLPLDILIIIISTPLIMWIWPLYG